MDNKKLMLKLEKPRLLNILSNNKFHYKINPKNLQNKYNHNKSLSPLLKTRNNKINNNTNTLNTFQNIKNNGSPIKTTNILKNTPSNIIKTTPLKFQYKKIPFEKVKGFKLKLPNTILNNKHKNNNKFILNTQQNYYPIIYEHNNSTIQTNKNTIKDKHNKRSYSNLNYNNILPKNTITSNNNTITKKNDTLNANLYGLIQDNIHLNNINKKLFYHINDTKSSSIGSKLETREESGHFKKSKSKSSFTSGQILNHNFHFVKNNNNLKQKNVSFLKLNKIKLSSKKKILKYLDKTIKQLTRIKTIILDEKESEEYKEDKNDKDIGDNDEINEDEEEKIKEEIKNKFIKIDLSKIGKNLEKYKNKIDIDKNTINISYDGNDNKIYPYNYNGLNNKSTLKKLNKTITYDDLKFNVKEKQKLLQIEQKSFKNFKKMNLNHKRNKSDNYNKYNTVNNYVDDYLSYKLMLKNNENNNCKIKNYDTEIKIPKLNINFNKKDKEENSGLNKIKEEDLIENIDINKINDRYNVDNEGEINADIANFEFSD